MSTPTLIKAQLKVAIDASVTERTVRRAQLTEALEGTNATAIASARHDVALIEGIVSSLKNAYQRAAALKVA